MDTLQKLREIYSLRGLEGETNLQRLKDKYRVEGIDMTSNEYLSLTRPKSGYGITNSIFASQENMFFCRFDYETGRLLAPFRIWKRDRPYDPHAPLYDEFRNCVGYPSYMNKELVKVLIRRTERALIVDQILNENPEILATYERAFWYAAYDDDVDDELLTTDGIKYLVSRMKSNCDFYSTTYKYYNFYILKRFTILEANLKLLPKNQNNNEELRNTITELFELVRGESTLREYAPE